MMAAVAVPSALSLRRWWSRGIARSSPALYNRQLRSPATAAFDSGASEVAMAATPLMAVQSVSDLAAAVSTDYIPSWVQKGATIGFTIALTALLSQRARGGADKAKNQQVRSYVGLSEEEKNRLRNEKIENQKKLAWPNALGGSLTAGLMALVMWSFTAKIIDSFDAQSYAAQSKQLTVQQMTTTVRTIIEGLAYLASSVLSLVSLGLGGLAIQLALNPDSLREEIAAAAAASGEEQEEGESDKQKDSPE